MKLRLWILLGLAVAVSAYFLVVERPAWDADRTRVQDERVVLDFDPERIIGFELFRGDLLVTVSRQEDGEWWIRTPIEYPVRKGGVRNFLDQVLEAERHYQVAETLEPEREVGFGLDTESAALLTLFDRDGFQLHLRVGKATPTGDAYYFQRGGDAAVHLGTDPLNSIRLLNYQGLRDPTLFEIEPPDVQTIGIATAGQSYDIRRDEKNLWRLSGSHEGAADGSKLKQWIVRDAVFELCNGRVRGYLYDGMTAEGWSVHGLGEQAPRLRWASAEAEGGLALGNESEQVGQIFARRLGEDTLFTIASTLLDFASTPLSELLDPSPIDADFNQLVGMEATWPDGIALRSAGNGYEQETILNGAVTDELSVVTQNVFYGLSRLDVVGQLELTAGQGLEQILGDRPVRIQLRFPSESILVELGEAQGRGSYWLRVDGDDIAYQIERGIYLRILGWRQAVDSLG